MGKVIQCSCGPVVCAEDEDGLVSKAQQHARELHGMELTWEQSLTRAQPA